MSRPHPTFRGATVVGLVVGVAASLLGCGSTASNSKPETAASETKSVAKHEKKKKVVPAECYKEKKRGECLPPPKWAHYLCEDVYPDIALHMMRPSTPWQRLYLLANAKAFNASGGASLLGEELQYGEEVIALRRFDRGAGEFQVGSDGYASGYVALRWNGACVTIHDGEFSKSPRGDVKHSRVEWRRLGLPTRKALQEDPTIFETYNAKRKSCRGAIIGTVSKECEEYDQQLVEEVVRYVRNDGELPEPKAVRR